MQKVIIYNWFFKILDKKMSLDARLRMNEEKLKGINASELIQELYSVLSNSEITELLPLEVGREYDLKTQEYDFLEFKCHEYFAVQKVIRKYFSDLSIYLPNLLLPEKVNELPPHSRDAVLTLMCSDNFN
jgi:hypothetical protein